MLRVNTSRARIDGRDMNAPCNPRRVPIADRRWVALATRCAGERKCLMAR